MVIITMIITIDNNDGGFTMPSISQPMLSNANNHTEP